MALFAPFDLGAAAAVRSAHRDPTATRAAALRVDCPHTNVSFTPVSKQVYA